VRKWKWLAVLLSATLLLGMMPALAAADGDGTITLYADQDLAVGRVEVSNTWEHLRVKYVLDQWAIDEGWYLVQTHLHVGEEPSDFPTAGKKQLNPVPGQFDYSDPHGNVTEYEYVIPLGDWVAGDDLLIAAHAVIEKTEFETVPGTLTPTLTWQRSSESDVAVFPGYGAQWTKEQGLAIPLDPAVLVWDGGQAGQYYTGYSTRGDISWASWTCTQNPTGKSTTGTDLRRFQTTFDIPSGYTVTGGFIGSVNPGYAGVIPMNDNIYIFVNEELVFWGGTISVLDPPRTHFLGMERRPTEPQNKALFPETDGWHMSGAIPEVSGSLFVEGSNVLDVFAEEFWTGGGMHELGLTLNVEITTCTTYTETAWGATAPAVTRFTPKGDWATYFGYEVSLCVPRAIADGELTVTGTGWKAVSAWLNPYGYDFAADRHSYNLDCAGEPIALQGYVDTSAAELANTGDWSKYYAKFSIRDSAGKTVEVVFGNDWLGQWYELPAQQWDRIRLENNLGLAQPQQHYATQGGVLGYDMDGIWVSAGNGATVYPSSRVYFFQLIVDPEARTFTLEVLGKGSSAPANPPAAWPKQNMYDEARWLQIGTITAGPGTFNFNEVEFYSILWASTQAGADDTSTVSWYDMEIDFP